MLTILFYFLSITYEKLTFPFVINKDNSSFYERNIETNMTTNISVGMPRIIVPLTITLRQYPFCITDIHSNVKKGIPKYTPDRSDTFDEVWGATDIDEEGLFLKGIQVYDNFNFGNENIEFNQFKFILVRNANKNFSGILGLSIGIISAVITCVYLGYSGYIFNNETIRTIPRLYENKATWKWNGQKYVANYDETSSDYDEGFIKIKDLGKKQYNYDTDIYKASKDTKSEFNGCKSAVVPYTRIDYQGTKHCDYIWINDVQNDSVTNKFLYDRWVTTLLFSAIICVCGIGLCIFGFLVFNNEVVKEVYDSPHPVPVTSSIGTTVNRLKNGNHENNGNNENPNN